MIVSLSVRYLLFPQDHSLYESPNESARFTKRVAAEKIQKWDVYSVFCTKTKVTTTLKPNPSTIINIEFSDELQF